jgi:ribosomal protein L19E
MWCVRRRRRTRQERQLRTRQLIGAEGAVKPQLEDTSTAWEDNIHTYKRELSASQEVHELDSQAGRVLPSELRAGPYDNRHEMEGSLERPRT